MHSTLEEEDPAKAYASPNTPENKYREGQSMDVKFTAKDRKRSTPSHICKGNNRNKNLTAADAAAQHQVNLSMGNPRESNSSMVKHQVDANSSLFNSQHGGSMATQMSVSRIRQSRQKVELDVLRLHNRI